MDLGLKGRRVLVTGASKGIGYAVADRMAREGCEIVLVARSADLLEQGAARLRNETGAKVSAVAIDLAARGAPEQLAAREPAIDVLVNNAGAIPGGSLEQVSEQVWRDAWDLKVFGYINLTRAYLPKLRECRGVVVNVIGAAGLMLDADYIAGSVGNAALIAFTEALGAATPATGVRVVGVNPGPVSTERIEKILRGSARQKLGDENRWTELAAKFAMGRCATVEEISAAVAFLASPLSAYTSGTTLTVDAGMLNRRA